MDISKLEDNKLSTLIDNLWKDSSTLWSVVEKQFSKNLKIWQNEPKWLETIPSRRSKARDNRIFLAVESVINTLTGRPSKPNTVNILETDEAKQLASDLNDVFIQKYSDLGMKAKLRRGLRYLFLSRFICLKVVWDKEKDDFDTITVDSRNVRVNKRATSMYDAEFVIEEVKDISLKKLISIFPDKREKILKMVGYTEQQIETETLSVDYYEAWIDGQVIYKFKDEILDKEKHPYWDWTGMKATTQEMIDLKKGNNKLLKTIGKEQDKRVENLKEGEKSKYESYLYNYFSKPIPPYVFGTVLSIEDGPIGASSLIDQAEPLQEEIDKRKRQISDNTEMMNGQYKVDTKYTKISKAEAQAAKSDPRGIWYGDGVKQGVDIMVGRDIPATVTNDMNHSIAELDNIFGTQPTFRGEGGASETATGRAILREQSYQRLDELIDLIDNLHIQIYSWWFQMIKTRYTEEHLIKIVGKETAQRIITLTRDDIFDGMEIKVIPGQIIPQDRLFKSERAKEEVIAGIIDPLTYFRETERDNPEELAKNVIKFRLNPASIVDLDEKDMADLQRGLQQTQQSSGRETGDKADRLAELRSQAEALFESDDFKALDPAAQEEARNQIEQQMKRLINSK